MKKKIIIVAGDPNSINSELIYKVWKHLSRKIKNKIYLIVNFNLFKTQLKKLKYKCYSVKVQNLNENINSNALKIIDIPLKFKNSFNVNMFNASNYILKSLNLAHKLALKKNVQGLVNCPINKKLIQSSKKFGVTEFLAAKCGIKNHSEIMMIYNKKLSVVPITTHIDLKNVSKRITPYLIRQKVLSLNKNFKILFKKKPKIGILGLNPHNAELKNNSEEIKKIIPAIKRLRKIGLNITGPLVADTVFIKNYKKYDVIMGMYHDQVLGPFKTMFKFDAINITLGLSYVRVSPDHGPALDMVKQKKSNYFSLLQSIKFIDNLK